MNSMTKIKLCGLMTEADILTADELMPDYIGFVFAPKSRRYVAPGQAERLKGLLDPRIRAVGVFVNEAPERIAELLEEGIIDIGPASRKRDSGVCQGAPGADRPAPDPGIPGGFSC